MLLISLCKCEIHDVSIEFQTSSLYACGTVVFEDIYPMCSQMFIKMDPHMYCHTVVRGVTRVGLSDRKFKV